MTLIRIGQVIINFDQVTHIWDHAVKDAAGRASPGPLRIEFRKGDYIDVYSNADSLRSWLTTNSVDLTTPATP